MKTLQQAAVDLANEVSLGKPSDLQMVAILQRCTAALAEARREALMEAMEICLQTDTIEHMTAAGLTVDVQDTLAAAARAIEARAVEVKP